MSNVITVKNLGKKYTLHHQQRESYTALRDVIANGVTNFGRKLLSPFTIHSIPLPLYPLAPASEDFWTLKDVLFEVKLATGSGLSGVTTPVSQHFLEFLYCIKGSVASILEVGTGFHP